MNRIPYNFLAYTEILVDDNVSHTTYLLPFNIRGERGDFAGNIPRASPIISILWTTASMVFASFRNCSKVMPSVYPSIASTAESIFSMRKRQSLDDMNRLTQYSVSECGVDRISGDKIDGATQQLAQQPLHTYECEQPDSRVRLEIDKDIHITARLDILSCHGTKQEHRPHLVLLQRRLIGADDLDCIRFVYVDLFMCCIFLHLAVRLTIFSVSSKSSVWRTRQVAAVSTSTISLSTHAAIR